jgi:SAM-dependent methyltransferase
MATVSPMYSAPFDAVAEEYDHTFTDSNVGRAQRISVWKELARTFRAGDRILDIGCGTGVDACFLADLGATVLACDSSPVMIAVADRRIRNSHRSKVHLRLLPAENLTALGEMPCFDGAFSNFAALNCVEDLRRVASSLAQLLKPRATFMVCMMGRHCAWEILWYLSHGDRRKAFRRIRAGEIRARLAPEAVVCIYYPSVNSLVRTFLPEFRLKYWKGIGITVPPSYLEHLTKQYPRCVSWLLRADSLLERVPFFRACADHMLLSFERVIESGGSQ